MTGDSAERLAAGADLGRTAVRSEALLVAEVGVLVAAEEAVVVGQQLERVATASCARSPQAMAYSFR